MSMFLTNTPKNNACREFRQCRTLEPLMSWKSIGEWLNALDFQNRCTIKFIFSLYKKKIIKFRGYVVCGMPGVYKSRGSRRYLYIKDSVGIDRILLPMLSPDTWKFILINCLLCYDPTYNSNVTLRNVTVNYFQTQFLLFSSISPYTFYALINT